MIPEEQPCPAREYRVLVVDDLPDVRVTLAGLLSDEGYDVRSASNRVEALNLIEAEPFDVAVLDVRLDESDEDNRGGLILMHDIKERHPHIAIIILTGYADVKMVREALQPDRKGLAPAFGFLEKSEIGELLEYVDRACKSIRSEPSVIELIAQGESNCVEFKTSIRWDYQSERVNKLLREVIAKCIAGMLNSEGGYLLIGAGDDGTIIGIEKDLLTLRKSNIDGFELALTDIVKNYLGLECVPYIQPRFEIIQEKRICVVSIEMSPRPVFLKRGGSSEFWVRAGNSTRRLDAREATRYISEK
jgi:CheY-like chemotaxis protein